MDATAAWLLYVSALGVAAGFVVGLLSRLLRIRPLIIGAALVAVVLIAAAHRHDPSVIAVLMVSAWTWRTGGRLARWLALACNWLWVRVRPLKRPRTGQ